MGFGAVALELRLEGDTFFSAHTLLYQGDPMLMTTDILPHVRQVLELASRGKGTDPTFFTSYQILDRLPATVRDRIIQERGLGGRGSGTSYSASSLVGDAAERVEGVIVSYLDTSGLTAAVSGQTVAPGNAVCGLYRVSPRP